VYTDSIIFFEEPDKQIKINNALIKVEIKADENS